MTHDRRKLFPGFLVLLILSGSTVRAQHALLVTIGGRVLDDSSGLALQNVDVFIANSTLGCATNEQGTYAIRNVPLGTHELVASRVGYVLATRFIRITDSAELKFEFRLKPKVITLGAVEVVAPEPVEWKKDLAKFEEFFIGEGPHASKTTLLNPEVLSFTKDSSGQFEAHASKPLRIENWGLGYRIQLELVSFVISGRWLTYSWKAFYRSLPSSGAEQDREWALRRLRTYKGSLRHFLASLATGTAEEQGFLIFSVKRFDATRIRWPVAGEHLVSPGDLPNEKELTFGDFLEVEYPYGIDWRGQTSAVLNSRVISYISWLELTRGRSTISTLGTYSDPFSIRVTGWWAGARIADELPDDFVPLN